MPAWSRALLCLCIACSGTESTPSSPSSPSDEDGDGTDDPIEVGGFTLQGSVVDVFTWTRTGEGLCLSVADATAIAQGEDLDIRAETVIGSDGAWMLEDVPVGGTTGLYLLLDDCSGDGSAVPTATLVLPEQWAGLGPTDTLQGVEVFHLSQSRLELWEEAMDDAGNTRPIIETGTFMGHIEDLEGNPMIGAWLMTSEGSRIYYDLGDDDWGVWSDGNGTTTEGGGRFAVPGAAWGNFIAKGLGTDYIPLVLGGLPEYVIYHRWEAQISDYGDVE